MASKTIPKVKPDSWLLGSVKPFSEDPLGFLEKCAETHGGIFQFRTGHKRIIIVNRPDYVEHVLQKNHHNYKNFFAVETLKPLLGDTSVFVVSGEKWKRERRLMQPQFNKQSVRSYFTTIDDQAKEMTRDWSSKSEVWLHSEMTKLTLDIITRCFLGGNVPDGGVIVKENVPYVLKVMSGRIQSPIQPPLWFPTAKNRKFKKSIMSLKKIVTEIIKKKEKEGNFSGNDMITMFLLLERKGEAISKQQIFDQLMTIMIAGHETTASSMFSIITNVYKDDTVRKKVIEEYDRVTQGNPIKVEHLSQLQYVNNVINESIRLWPPAFMMGREAIEDEEMDGYPIKKGDTVLVIPYLIHRNKELWKNPNAFDPDRFDQELPHKYAHFPFGGGPRLCIGKSLAMMEMQVILYHILKSDFEIEALSNKEIEYEVALAIRPKSDIRVIKSLKK